MATLSGSLDRSLLSDQAYEVLRTRLLAGEYAPGSRLVESEIARQLSVSQAPVREALRRLAHEGWVLQLPRRGSFVAEISTDEARSTYAVRAALETIAVQGCLARIEEEVFNALEDHVTAMATAADEDNLAGLIEADVNFHRTVWETSGNELLTRIWPMVEGSMRNLTVVSNRLYFTNLKDVALTHRPLLEGLRSRDPGVAAEFRDHALVVWRLLAADEDATDGERPESRHRGARNSGRQ